MSPCTPPVQLPSTVLLVMGQPGPRLLSAVLTREIETRASQWLWFLQQEGQAISGGFLAFLADVLMGVAAVRQEARRGQGQHCSETGTCCWLRVTLAAP